MGWSFRKSLRILPGIRINLSKSGPRLSVGVPGARASVDMQGKTRLYGGAGPLRYQKTVTIGSVDRPNHSESGLLAIIKKVFGGR
jgi:hypothetical protein